MTTYLITVPKVDKWMNANDRPNRWTKADQTKGWRQAAHIAALKMACRRVRLTPPVRIVVTVHIADKRRREVSNLFPTFKACIDGFVDAGLLADDSDAHVIGPDPRRGYEADSRLVFELTEVAS